MVPPPHYREMIDAEALPSDPTPRASDASVWSDSWWNGTYHFHSTAHDVLGIVSGRVTVHFGGSTGPKVSLVAGDVTVPPTGTM